jgi:hypothetical protein
MHDRDERARARARARGQQATAIPPVPGRVGGVVQAKLAVPGRVTAVKEPTPGGGGAALPVPVRARMEAVLGASFASVRIHEDGQAGELGARAVARGEDIFFAPGQYDPTSSAGAELLAHELAHVVQQRSGRARGGGDTPWLDADPALEAEADAVAARVAGTPTPATAATAAPAPAPAPSAAPAVAVAVAQCKLVTADGEPATAKLKPGAQLAEDDASHMFYSVAITFVRRIDADRIVVRDGLFQQEWTYNVKTHTYKQGAERAVHGRKKHDSSDDDASSSDDERGRKQRKQKKSKLDDERGRDRKRDHKGERKREKPPAKNPRKRGADHRGQDSDDRSPDKSVQRTEEISQVTDKLRPPAMELDLDVSSAKPEAKADAKSGAKKRVTWPDPGYQSGSESEDSDFEADDHRARKQEPFRKSDAHATMRQHQTELVARRRTPGSASIELRRELQVYWRYLEDRIAYLANQAKREELDGDDERELDRLTEEREALRATVEHHEALDDAEVEAYNRRLSNDSEHAAEGAPNLFVPQSRGIHYSRANFTCDERRDHRETSEIGAPVFSSAAYELLNEELAETGDDPVHPGDPRLDRHGDQFDLELFERLEEIAREIRTRIHDLGEADASKVNIGGGERTELALPFDNLADVHQTVYSNSYAKYHDDTELAATGAKPTDGKLAAVFEVLFAKGQPQWSSNPMVSTGDEAEHPQRYALGDKPPTGINRKTQREFREERLRPRYNASGEGDPHARRPYSGKTYLSLHPADEMLGETAPSHVSSLQGDWRTDVGHRIFQESESSFAGLLERDRVVFHQDAKFPSFVGPYDPAYELKYGLSKKQYDHFQAIFRTGGVQGDETVKAAKRELAQLLATHNGRRADEEAELQAARMGGIVRSRDLDGGFAREPARPSAAHDRRRELASLVYAAQLVDEIANKATPPEKKKSAEKALAQYARQFDTTAEKLTKLVDGKSFDELRDVLVGLHQGEDDEVEPPQPGKDVMPDVLLAAFLGERRPVIEQQSGTFYPFRDYRIPHDKDGKDSNSSKGEGKREDKRDAQRGDGGLGRGVTRQFSLELGQLATEAFYADPTVKLLKLKQEAYHAYRDAVNELIRKACRDKRVTAAIEADDPALIAEATEVVRAELARALPEAIEWSKRAERELLLPEHYEVVRIDGRGDCLFEASGLGDVVELRKRAAAYIRQHPTDFAASVPGMLASQIADYIETPGNWNALPGDVAPLALAMSQGVTLYIHSPLYDIPQEINPGHKPVYLLYSGSHYDSLVYKPK